MIRNLLRTLDWRALLVPAGAALLSAGVDHLDGRREQLTADLAALGELVTYRREQLDGRRPLDDEPDPVPVDEPSSSRARPVGWATAAAVLAVFGLGLMLARQRAAADVVPDDLADELPEDVYAAPDPWQHAQPVDEMSDRAADAIFGMVLTDAEMRGHQPVDEPAAAAAPVDEPPPCVCDVCKLGDVGQCDDERPPAPEQPAAEHDHGPGVN